MAETKLSNEWTTRANPKGPGEHVAVATFTGAHLGVVDDIIRGRKLARFCRITGWFCYMGDFDTGAGLTVSLQLYDSVADTAVTLLTDMTIGQAGGYLSEDDSTAAEVLAGLNKLLDTGDWEVRLLTTTAVGTAEQSATTRFGVRYYME